MQFTDLKDNLCREQDAYVQDFYNCRQAVWVAELSNGEKIYQDDNRPGVYPHSAWVRLKSYCREKELSIVSLNIEFRSNKVELQRGAEGYFFTKACGAWLGQDSTEQYGIGILSGNVVHIQFFQVPELCVCREEFRPRDKCAENLICQIE